MSVKRTIHGWEKIDTHGGGVSFFMGWSRLELHLGPGRPDVPELKAHERIEKISYNEHGLTIYVITKDQFTEKMTRDN